MKVWLVSTGDYSAFRIRAAFSDEAIARTVADKMRGDVHEFDILEAEPEHVEWWEIDGHVEITYKNKVGERPHFHTQNLTWEECGMCTPIVFEWNRGQNEATLVGLYPSLSERYEVDQRPLGVSVDDKYHEKIYVSVRAETKEKAEKIYHDEIGRAMAKLARVTD